ncbi:hypothetical protein E2C01_052190 [Portunus trituberculatus]|uniref:Uncharacterized protein n=1 Tax=Portunus trituberculatus TaxID=210409 RepID=A0A5B7GL92_PORTR|nr:hypothetical protein [Portunus trituberculatus]
MNKLRHAQQQHSGRETQHNRATLNMDELERRLFIPALSWATAQRLRARLPAAGGSQENVRKD